MTRECIYVGDNEIIARYVGTKLIWELVTLEVAHFENLDGWASEGETNLIRSFNVQKAFGDTQQPDLNYNAFKAKVNGKFYDIKGAELVVKDWHSAWHYSFIITFKNRSDRDEVARMYQKDIYLYKRG